MKVTRYVSWNTLKSFDLPNNEVTFTSAKIRSSEFSEPITIEIPDSIITVVEFRNSKLNCGCIFGTTNRLSGEGCPDRGSDCQKYTGTLHPVKEQR